MKDFEAQILRRGRIDLGRAAVLEKSRSFGDIQRHQTLNLVVCRACSFEDKLGVEYPDVYAGIKRSSLRS